MKLNELKEQFKFDVYKQYEDLDELYSFPKTTLKNYKLYPREDRTDQFKIILEMIIDGYRPATVLELLEFSRDCWDKDSMVVALGSISGGIHENIHRSNVYMGTITMRRSVPFIGTASNSPNTPITVFGSIPFYLGDITRRTVISHFLAVK